MVYCIGLRYVITGIYRQVDLLVGMSDSSANDRS